MAGKLGILAGGGRLPGHLIAACRASGREFFVIAFEGNADRAVIGDAPCAWMRLGAAGAAIARLHDEAVEEVVLAGPVKRPTLASLRPDARTARFLARGVLKMGDDGLLGAVVRTLEEDEGLRVVGAEDVLGELTPQPGVLGRHAPDAQGRADIARAIAVVRALGALDVGQAAVAQQGVVLGIEAAEGTAELLTRCAPLHRPGPGGVLVKMAKPGQERRADLPTIGRDTVEQAAAGGLAGIALAAGATLLLDRAEAIARADAAGLFIYAFATEEFAAEPA